MPAARPDTPYPDLPLTLITLGGATLVSPSSSGPERPLLGPGKPLALLVYLACAPRRTATRDHLVDLLWADVHPERGRHALRQTIWYIKRTVGTPLLNTVDGRIELVRTIPCDRDVLLAAVEVGDPESVVRAYRGEFLPSFAIPGGSEFERWADVERLRLRAHFLQAADDLTRRHLAAARFKEGVALARRARDEAPLDERPWRLLFEALAASGDQLRFAAEVEAFQRQLTEDEREPDEATQVRMRWPGTEAPVEGSEDDTTLPLAPDLVGRQREFTLLLRAWDSARAGPARHLHLSAAAGLGKTRLLHDSQRRLRAGGARTIYLRSSPGTRYLAHSYVGDLVRTLAALPGAKGIPEATAGVLVALDPSLSAAYRAAPDPSTGDEALRHRILALADLIRSIAEESPLALFLDDLHWSDEASRRILTGALDRLDGARVFVVTAARPLPEAAALRDRAEAIDLLPLITPQLGELVASIGPLPAADWSEGFPDRLWSASNGSPLLALEALQLALDESILRLDAEGWHCDAPALLDAAFPAGGALRRRVEGLPRLDGWLLLLLALEGAPVTATDLLAIAGHPAAQAEEALQRLEQKGFVVRTGPHVEPAHDEFARLAAELADAQATAAAHRALAERAQGIRGRARHLRAAGEHESGRQLFRAWVAERRKRGDRRPSADLANDFLGPDLTADDRAALIASLPLAPRLWGSRRARMLTLSGAAAVTLLLGAFVFRTSARGPHAPELIAIAEDDGDPHVGIVPLHAGPADATQDLITLRPGADTTWIDVPVRTMGGPPYVRTDGTIAIQLNYPDSGGVDVAVRDPNGTVRRLTSDPQDENVAGWSPDGRYIIGTSGANSRPGATDYDVMALDPRTGAIRYLTTGRAHDQGPKVSPDGTRLAFIRMSLDTVSDREICVAWFDGTEIRCTAVPDGEAIAIYGWADRHRLVVGTRTAGGASAMWLDIRDLKLTAIRGLGTSTGVLSPDRRWFLCNCRPENPGAWEMFDLNAPSRLIEIRGANGPPPPHLDWVDRAGSDTTWLERVTLRGPATLEQGATARYEGSGSDAAGRPIGDIELRWSSRDTTVLPIERRTGVAHAKRLGTTWIVASAGGWRTDSLKVTITRPGEVATTREDWSEGWEARWSLGGDPLPRRMIVDGGPALNVNGDGSFLSGVDRWPGWRGESYGAEFTIRLKYTRMNWQSISFGIDRGTDSASLARWDHRTGTAPRSGDGVCGAAHASDSRFWLEHLAVTGGVEVAAPRVGVDFADGKSWRHVRVQVFPDGGCGIALDGRPLWLSTTKLPRRGPPVVFAYGMSYHTNILVRSIETWEGVRPGVDWSTAPTTVELLDQVRRPSTGSQ